ncbi:MAG: rod-binding protein [Sphingomonadales bacterium]|nr:rod-binding protein [Sphingomonadales bacterium]
MTALPTAPALALATGAAGAAGAAAPAAPGAQASRAQVAKVARQFEAIFIRQMLAEARKTTFDKDGLFSSQGNQTFQEMQDSRFADIAADKGTFGLAKMIEKQLLARSSASAPTTAPAAATGQTGG